MSDILSSTTNLSNLVPNYYSKRLLERLEPKTRAYQLADKKKIPANSGKTIIWNRYVQLSDGMTLSEGVTPGPSAMSTVIVSASLVQKGNLVKLTDMIEETAISDVVKDAVDVLSDNAAQTIDKYILNEIGWFMSAVGTLNGASACAYSYQFPFAFSKTSGNLDGERGFSVDMSVNVAADTICSLPMNISAIRKAVTKLKKRFVPTFDDGLYHALIHPDMVDALRSDPQWADWNKYTKPELMSKGVVGEVEMVRFYEDPNMSSFNISGASILGTANVSNLIGSSFGRIFGTLIFGKGAYAVTELEGSGTGDNATKVYTVARSVVDKADPLQQFSYVGYKSTLAAKILNPSCGLILLTNGTAYI